MPSGSVFACPCFDTSVLTCPNKPHMSSKHILGLRGYVHPPFPFPPGDCNVDIILYADLWYLYWLGVSALCAVHETLCKARSFETCGDSGGRGEGRHERGRQDFATTLLQTIGTSTKRIMKSTNVMATFFSSVPVCCVRPLCDERQLHLTLPAKFGLNIVFLNMLEHSVFR